jgi:hypothetical protein
MQYRLQIEDQDTLVFTHGGTVEGVMARSNTEVWSEGGGGYVGPHGGYVSAPTVRSRTSHFKEVRFVTDSGQRKTFSVEGHVTVMPGDRVSFVYASLHAKQKGPMVGFINHTENHWWSFDSNEVLPYKGHWGLRCGVLFALLVTLPVSFPLFLFGSVGVIIAWAASRSSFFNRVNEAVRQQVRLLCSGVDPRQAVVNAPPALPRSAAVNLS